MMVGSSVYSRYGKRGFDLIAATIALAILCPVLLALACLVWLRLGHPILFRQVRPGRGGKPFALYKFRTMREATDATGRPLSDAERLTPFGSWLRSTSLDELPELWNVLRGDMSLVGPRPLLMEYLDRYTPEQMRRHEVRPGLTGLAQVSGRNALSWEERFALDVQYVDRHSLLIDLRIMAMTVWKVFSRDGITSAGNATAAPFEPQAAVVTIGAGGHGKVVISILQACGIPIEAVYDDDPRLWGQDLLGVPIPGPVSQLQTIARRRSVIAVGDNERRALLAADLDLEWITAVHPTAILHPTAVISLGAVVCACAVIQPDCHVGHHAIVNTGATLDHDCQIGDFSSVGPGASLAGAVHVSPKAMIGTGCALLPGVRIGRAARIGAGATVTRDIADGITAYGIPARPAPDHSAPVSLGSWPEYDDEQIAAVERVLRSGKVNSWTGEECSLFEKEYASALGVSHTIAVANGTVALELALQSLGIGPGDEVIVPSRTFIASASAVVMRGATPIIADIDALSQNITTETIAAKLSPRTKAIIAVHLAGWPCDMDPIMSLAKQHALFVVEDCAQAHGAKYKGRPVGSIGHINAFSFCQDKIISTGGEGGLVSTDDASLWERAWSFKDHGKSRAATLGTHRPGGFRFVHERFGTNWRMTEMQAAIGRVQLRRLADWVEQRRANARRLMDGLADVDGIAFPIPGDDFFHSYYRLYGLLDPSAFRSGWTRDRIIEELLSRGVGSGCGSCGEIYLEKAFDGCRPASRLPVATKLHETSLVFMVHPTLQPSHIAHTLDVCRDVFSTAFGSAQVAERHAA
ncbi:MAG: NeuD/PglB/VioB family sugar acetyltransferase [Planctomycetia bacterium]